MPFAFSRTKHRFSQTATQPLQVPKANAIAIDGNLAEDELQRLWERRLIYKKVSSGNRNKPLTQNGPRVKIGDRVAKGDTIGLSGNTGASAGPHLHFDVTKGCPEWGCQTIPVVFINAKENPLQEGQIYKAELAH